MYICCSCKSNRVYSIEFNTSYYGVRSFNPVNKNNRLLDVDDLPYTLYGFYCNSCKELVTVRKVFQCESCGQKV